MKDAMTYNGVEFRAGDRVKLVAWTPNESINDDENVPPGTLGTVEEGVGSLGVGNAFPAQLWVRWDNGRGLNPSGPLDRVEKIG